MLSVHQLADKYCDSSNSYSAKTDAYRSYVETIAPQAYDSYRSCIELAGANVIITPTARPLANDFFVGVRYLSTDHGASQHTFQWSGSSGDNLTCNWNTTNKTSVIVRQNSSESLHCHRNDPSKDDEIVLTVLDRAQLPVGLHWPRFVNGVSVSDLATINAKLNQAQQSGRDEHERLDKEIVALSQGMLRAEIGQVEMSAKENASCPGDHRGNLHQKVMFSQPFHTTPRIVFGINNMDVYNDSNLRIDTILESLDQNGFTVSFVTWCNTRVERARLNWAAFGN